MKRIIIVRLVISALLLFSFSSCHKVDPRYAKTEEVIMTVRVYEGYLHNMTNVIRCYCHQDSSYWIPFYYLPPQTQGWGLEEGFEYKISVWKHWIKDPRISENAIEYELHEVYSKKEAPYLTREDITVIDL